jgi:hypothetical protein
MHAEMKQLQVKVGHLFTLTRIEVRSFEPSVDSHNTLPAFPSKKALVWSSCVYRVAFCFTLPAKICGSRLKLPYIENKKSYLLVTF